MTMVALPAIALVLVYWAGIDPFYRHPYWRYLDRATLRCSSGDSTFIVEAHEGRSVPKGEPVDGDPGFVRSPCLLKIDHMSYMKLRQRNDPPFVSNRLLYDEWTLSRDGVYVGFFTKPTGAGGFGHVFSAGEMAEIERLVAALPRSQGWIPIGQTVVVGFLDRGVWANRTYDKGNVPPELDALLAKLGSRL